ncbi:MAG: FHA domain-containing protein, partial [bacterium]
MAYRFIILNGEQRGERRDIDNHPLRVGRALESGLRLSDPDVLPDHALLIPEADGLMIRCLPDANPVQVNGIETRESPLRHGDVAQVGTTRLFVQALDNTVAWNNLVGFRKSRTWVAIGLPVLMLVATAILARHCRNPKP